MNPVILPATRWDVAHLAAVMRPSDIDECAFLAKMTGRFDDNFSIHRDLETAFKNTEIYSMWRGDRLLACGGVAPTPRDNAGAIWLLGTDAADEFPISLTKGAMQFVRAERKKWRWMGNIVPRHFEKRIKWLKHLGFDTDEKNPQKLKNGYVTFWSLS